MQQPCNMQPVFTVWWKNGKIVKNSMKPKSKDKWIFVDKNRESQSWKRRGSLPRMRENETSKGVGDREKAGSEIQERHAQIDECNQKLRRHPGRKQSWTRKPESCKQETKGETVMRRSPADAASIQSWWSSPERWEQHRLSSSLPLIREKQGSISQPAPATPVHVPEGGEGGDMRRSRGEERLAAKCVNQRRGTAMEGARVALHLILLNFQGMQVRATETSSSSHEEKEGEKEADTFAGKEVWIRADPVPIPFSPFKESPGRRAPKTPPSMN